MSTVNIYPYSTVLIKLSNSVKMIFVPVNSGIFLRFMSIIVSIMGYFLSTAEKHNRQNFGHNRSGPTSGLRQI